MLPRTSAASAEAAAMELEEAELRRLESGPKARNTKARARGGGAKVRFYLSKEKMKRIFAEHPELRSHYLKEVHSLGLPRTVFWARYCHAAAHMKRSLRCEAVQTASRGSNVQKRTMAQKVARIKEELALDPSLPVAKAVATANAVMGIEPQGTLPRQVDHLLKELTLPI